MRRCRTNIAQSFTNPNFRNQLTYRVNSVTIVGFFSSQCPTNLTKAFTTNHPVKFHHRWQQHGVRETVRNMQRRARLMRHRVAQPKTRTGKRHSAIHEASNMLSRAARS